MASPAALQAQLVRDLSAAAAAPVGVELITPARFGELSLHELEGQTIDALDIAIDDYGPPNADHLHSGGDAVEEVLVSDLLKSNCPVTGQPDWAEVRIDYRGPRIDPAGLLRYLVSFRDHAEFHEQCVERIFIDVLARCRAELLSVEARYTRRGGLDINPWRGTLGLSPPPAVRALRQ